MEQNFKNDSRIILLDDHLISKIAAGEVIERPSSVVKELIENSIDAGATEITVEVEEGGKFLIHITDNGSGMTRADAELSLERHATSKIRDENDLSDIHTLGFRGEALASIVSVSRFTLKTKTKESPLGTEIIQEGKDRISVKDTGMPPGTVIAVKDLFFNTPARLKYLKSTSTELGNIIDVITSYTLIYPGIYFRLISDGKPLLTSPQTSDMLANIATIYGKDVAQDMLKIEHTTREIKIAGYTSKPSLTRAGRKNQSIYVNFRYIKNNLITRAVYDAYHTLLPIGRHPLFIISIELDPRTIDVNVHPAKTEIRIEKENELYEAVYTAVKSALDRNHLIPKVIEKTIQKKIPIQYKEPSSGDRRPIYTSPASFPHRTAPRQMMIKEAKEEDFSFRKLPQLKILGQVSSTYIIAESKDSMHLIDQHAAAERINYEKLKRSPYGKEDSQSLLTPKIISLSPKDAHIMKDHLKILKSAGFDIEPYSDNSFSVRSIPVILGRQYDDSKITDVIDSIMEAARTSPIDSLKESLIKTIACKASIKAGDPMTDKEMLDLLKDLELCDAPYTCPHGRPTIIEMTISEIEKRFKRT
ncbi:MAG: DNA mismatch repair endonuclease MutL [archaeon]